VLDRATRVRGRVSADIDEAVIPLAERSGKGITVEGDVVFQDVEFIPGPLVDELFRLIGKEDRPSLKLNQPVALTIAERRVLQRGLAIPVGGLTQIEMEGWVDFDRNMALTASLPVTPALVGDVPVLKDIVEGTRISVPIRGSLSKPEIDREALKLAMKDLGKTLLERGATRGAAALLERLVRGRDPNAPPPLTREERRARREEQKAERQRERDNSP
jgi:translocation and assembly module TamB